MAVAHLTETTLAVCVVSRFWCFLLAATSVVGAIVAWIDIRVKESTPIKEYENGKGNAARQKAWRGS